MSRIFRNSILSMSCCIVVSGNLKRGIAWPTNSRQTRGLLTTEIAPPIYSWDTAAVWSRRDWAAQNYNYNLTRLASALRFSVRGCSNTMNGARSRNALQFRGKGGISLDFKGARGRRSFNRNAQSVYTFARQLIYFGCRETLFYFRTCPFHGWR